MSPFACIARLAHFARLAGLAGLLALSAHAVRAVEELPQSIPGGTMVDAAKTKSLQDGGAVVVDTRVAAEYADKHIKGAINVLYKETHPKESKVSPDDKFDLSKLPADKAKPMVFHCNGSPCWKGYKGAAAAIKAGYKNVYWFRDGMPAWEAAKLPTE